MKTNKIKTVIVAGVLNVFSCFSMQAQQGPKPTAEPTVYKGVTDAKCAVEVAFGSYGTGIDGGALEKVQAVITKNKLASTTTPIGREGEIRICLPMKGLNKRKKTAVIDALKKIAKEGQLVSVSIR